MYNRYDERVTRRLIDIVSGLPDVSGSINDIPERFFFQRSGTRCSGQIYGGGGPRRRLIG